MRILIFHGYLLRGTGSNVYNAELARALLRLGHEVHLLCQDQSPEELEWVDAVGTWGTDGLAVQAVREPAQCTVYRPNIGALLPVYVADRYAGVEARAFHECSEEEVDTYLAANVAAVRDVVQRARPEAALANHLVMGPAILARALEVVPYAVKIHGSALEYTVKPHPRFLPYAREGLAGAKGVLVGSSHTAESLWEAIPDQDLGLPRRTFLGPPGVDVHAFGLRDRDAAVEGFQGLRERLEAQQPATGAADSAFARDPAEAAAALARLDPGSDRLVAFVGKLIVSKGIDLLLAAWPLVIGRVPDVRLLVVGFGAYREGAERLVAALAAGDRGTVTELAEEGRAVEGGPREPLRMLQAFIGDAGDEYWDAARGMGDRVVFTGRLEHDELVDVLPACEAMVVPSTFPEAFGMVAAEAAACGALPVSAGHSGLAEVSETLAAALSEQAREWLAFPLSDAAVTDIADRLCGWLKASEAVRRETRAALAQAVRDHYSWEATARAVIAASTASPGAAPLRALG